MRVQILQGFDDRWIDELCTLLDPGIEVTRGTIDGTAGKDYHVMVAGRPERNHLEVASLHSSRPNLVIRSIRFYAELEFISS